MSKTNSGNNTQTVRGLKIYRKNHPKLKRLLAKTDSPEIHGDKIWFSSYFIMDHLESRPPLRKSRVMEIGCGWGLLGIYCAKYYGARVTAVDADRYVFPFLNAHAILNDVQITTCTRRYEDLKTKELHSQDMVLGGDICFWDKLVPPLYHLINKSLRAGVGKIVIADPGRKPFLKLAKRCRKQFGAELYEWDIKQPKKTQGYLLEIEKR